MPAFPAGVPSSTFTTSAPEVTGAVAPRPNPPEPPEPCDLLHALPLPAPLTPITWTPSNGEGPMWMVLLRSPFRIAAMIWIALEIGMAKPILEPVDPTPGD